MLYQGAILRSNQIQRSSYRILELRLTDRLFHVFCRASEMSNSYSTIPTYLLLKASLFDFPTKLLYDDSIFLQSQTASLRLKEIHQLTPTSSTKGYTWFKLLIVIIHGINVNSLMLLGTRHTMSCGMLCTGDFRLQASRRCT